MGTFVIGRGSVVLYSLSYTEVLHAHSRNGDTAPPIDDLTLRGYSRHLTARFSQVRLSGRLSLRDKTLLRSERHGLVLGGARAWAILPAAVHCSQTKKRRCYTIAPARPSKH